MRRGRACVRGAARAKLSARQKILGWRPKIFVAPRKIFVAENLFGARASCREARARGDGRPCGRGAARGNFS